MQETKKRSFNTIIAAASSKENIIPESNSRSKLSLLDSNIVLRRNPTGELVVYSYHFLSPKGEVL